MRAPNAAKKPAPKDWHKADIKALLEKRGWTLRRLAAHLDLNDSTLRGAFSHSYPASEKRIADALGLHPKEIWPSRYDEHGNPLGRRRSTTPHNPGVDPSTQGNGRRVKAAVRD